MRASPFLKKWIFNRAGKSFRVKQWYLLCILAKVSLGHRWCNSRFRSGPPPHLRNGWRHFTFDVQIERDKYQLTDDKHPQRGAVSHVTRFWKFGDIFYPRNGWSYFKLGNALQIWYVDGTWSALVERWLKTPKGVCWWSRDLGASRGIPGDSDYTAYTRIKNPCGIKADSMAAN